MWRRQCHLPKPQSIAGQRVPEGITISEVKDTEAGLGLKVLPREGEVPGRTQTQGQNTTIAGTEAEGAR
eukprot:1057649-Karenia_brevis.AAC.1